MNAINYGSIFLDPETAVLFFAVSLLAWLFRATRLAVCCAGCGAWLAFGAWFDPLFERAFEHLPIWVPLLVLAYVGWGFMSSVVDLFAGRGVTRRFAMRAGLRGAHGLGRALIRIPGLAFRGVMLATAGPVVLLTALANRLRR